MARTSGRCTTWVGSTTSQAARPSGRCVKPARIPRVRSTSVNAQPVNPYRPTIRRTWRPEKAMLSRVSAHVSNPEAEQAGASGDPDDQGGQQVAPHRRDEARSNDERNEQASRLLANEGPRGPRPEREADARPGDQEAQPELRTSRRRARRR